LETICRRGIGFAIDPAKGAGHGDYRLIAAVNHGALGSGAPLDAVEKPCRQGELTMTTTRFLRWTSLRARLACALAIGAFALFAEAGEAHAGSWAAVNVDGTLSKSRGVLANFRDGTGLYRIVFRRNLANCVPVVTMAGGSFGFPSVLFTGNAGEVQILIANEDLSALRDANFNIALVC
jgi:hypothetical protein